MQAVSIYMSLHFGDASTAGSPRAFHKKMQYPKKLLANYSWSTSTCYLQQLFAALYIEYILYTSCLYQHDITGVTRRKRA